MAKNSCIADVLLSFLDSSALSSALGSVSVVASAEFLSDTKALLFIWLGGVLKPSGVGGKVDMMVSGG